MKKAIVVSLAVIGGITVACTAFVGIASAVQAARAKKRYESMTPEEREAHKKRMDDVMTAIFDAYGFDKAKVESAEQTGADETSVEEVTA